MPIKWSALKVNDAADMIEEYVKQAAEPLEQAMIVAKEAEKLANLPQYITQALRGVLGEIERVTGGEHSFSKELYAGSITRAIERLREQLPKDALADDRKRLGQGDIKPLM